MVVRANSIEGKGLKQKQPNKVGLLTRIKNTNWLCKIGLHHWVTWSETDYVVGYHFDYVKCDRPNCKWSGLTWVEKTKIYHPY